MTGKTPPEKVRDISLRRAATRQGLRLERSRVRDPRATDYGMYRLVDMHTNRVAYPEDGAYGLTLDDVESILNRRSRPDPR